MNEPNYVQLLRTEKSLFLLTEYPLAFALLSYIAIHARRYNGHPDGLIIGDALVGFSSLPGLSRQNYRTALERLVNENLIKIVSNGRNWWGREKSTIKVTINSHLVNLCDTAVYNINSDDGNHQSNHQVTIDQPSSNHKQERTTKNNNVKEQQQTPTPLAPLPVSVVSVVGSFSCLEGFVLSNEDIQKLCSFPEVDVARAVQVRKEYKKHVDSEMGFLLRAIERKYQPKSNPQIEISDLAKSNRDKLMHFKKQEAEKLKLKDIEIRDCVDHAMFGPVKIPYEMEWPAFKDLVMNNMQRFNITPRAVPKLPEVVEQGKIVHLQSAGSIGQGILEQLEMKK